MKTKDKAREIARIAEDKKARDIVILDVKNLCNFTDYFVLATADSTSQIRAICGEIEEKLKESHIPARGMDGKHGSTWRVLDYGDVIFHCFSQETREYYNLEKLWADAEEIRWEAS